LNQVSSTSVSRRSAVAPQRGQAVGSCSATIVSPQPSASQYHTGSWWPHQSWREMHQGRSFSIQSR